MSTYKLHLVSVSPTSQFEETSRIYVAGGRHGEDASSRVIHRCSARQGLDVMLPLKRKNFGGSLRLTGLCRHCGYRLVVQA